MNEIYSVRPVRQTRVISVKRVFGWFFWSVVFIAFLGFLYILDYTNTINVPLMDEAYDGKKATIQNN